VHQESSKSGKLICKIDVTAFAGVMFALVAMFLLPTMVVHSPRNAANMPLDMAKASHASAMQAANREDALLIAVGRNGNVWFDTEVIGVNDLSVKIRARVSQGAERKVYIRADARASYGVVLQVLDGVRAAGVENIAFVVDERKSAHQ
jgi:biopolymer transport protein TolR